MRDTDEWQFSDSRHCSIHSIELMSQGTFERKENTVSLARVPRREQIEDKIYFE